MTTIHKTLHDQFGFVADGKKSIRHNVAIRLALMPAWYYFNRPSHSAYHDFTKTKTPPKNLRSLLGLGLKFIPTPNYTNTWSRLKKGTYNRLVRSLKLRFHFAGVSSDDNDETDDDYNPKMYVKSTWTPPPWTYPSNQMDRRMRLFEKEMSQLFKRRRGKPNLLPHQSRALQRLQLQKDFLIVPCDKNLGPAIIQTEDYLRIAFRDHLNDKTTYERLTESRQNLLAKQINNGITDWIKRNRQHLTKMEKQFLTKQQKENKTPFARFYLTLKAHKLKPGEDVDQLKSRPIVSCPGSLLHPLGIWVDSKLQIVAREQKSYFKNSFELTKQLLELGELPANARLFTADARSMYTNIPTNSALAKLRIQLNKYQSHHDRSYPASAVQTALRLIMTHNVFTFGDMAFLQLNGTAMGTPPAPPYATLYGAFEEDPVLQQFQSCLLFYRRFIDDVFGIYLCLPNQEEDEEQWNAFKTAMNKPGGLIWDFSERVTEIDFMDLHLSIQDRRITTSLFEKALNLHLYIPPHSAHPPGLLPGLVFGNLFRIYTLCTDDDDKTNRTKIFFRRLLARGYKTDQLQPLFARAITTARNYTGPTGQGTSNTPTNSMILHLPYHPGDPQSHLIQRTWRNCVAAPRYSMPIWNIKNPTTREPSKIQRLIIAYSRTRNLGNILSHRDMNDTGPPASSFYED